MKTANAEASAVSLNTPRTLQIVQKLDDLQGKHVKDVRPYPAIYADIGTVTSSVDF